LDNVKRLFSLAPVAADQRTGQVNSSDSVRPNPLFSRLRWSVVHSIAIQVDQNHQFFHTHTLTHYGGAPWAAPGTSPRGARLLAGRRVLFHVRTRESAAASG
jgi:hypothetical protein